MHSGISFIQWCFSIVNYVLPSEIWAEKLQPKAESSQWTQVKKYYDMQNNTYPLQVTWWEMFLLRPWWHVKLADEQEGVPSEGWGPTGETPSQSKGQFTGSFSQLPVSLSQGRTTESKKVLIRKSRHNVKCSLSYVTLPACLSIHHSVSRHLPYKIAILPLVCNQSFTPQWPATSGNDLNGEQEGQTDVLQKQLILEQQRKHCRFTLEFRSVLERYVEMGLETLWVSSYCSQPLLQSLLPAGCRLSCSESGERQLSHRHSAVWLMIGLWV